MREAQRARRIRLKGRARKRQQQLLRNTGWFVSPQGYRKPSVYSRGNGVYVRVGGQEAGTKGSGVFVFQSRATREHLALQYEQASND